MLWFLKLKKEIKNIGVFRNQKSNIPCCNSNALPQTAQRWIKDHCGLHLAREKSEVFTWDGHRPAGCLPGLTQAGTMVGDTFEAGMVVYGMPVGTDIYVKHMLMQKVDELTERAKKSCSVLGEERQALWTTLRASLSQTFDYWLMLVHPTQIQEVAQRVDNIFWSVLESSVGCAIPRTKQGLGYETVMDVPVTGLSHQTFQSWVTHLPISKGGLGGT